MTATERGPLALRQRGTSVQIDRGLVEKAVLLAVEQRPTEERREFHRQRDPVYDLHPSRRETTFEDLHAWWFERLALAEPLLALLAGQPSIERSTAACLVVPAARRKDEHADLRDRIAYAEEPRAAVTEDSRQAGLPVLVIRLRASTLVDAGRLERLLRRELFYVADMLDPAFGYDPEVAVRETSGPFAGLLRERHELLWRVVVDGRMASGGDLEEAAEARLLSRFRSAFPALGESCERTFRDLFRGPRPSHPELLRLARFPGAEDAGSGECPLCRMAAPAGRLARGTLSERAVAAVRRDFPRWRPEDGLCEHCADLYDLRERAGAGAGADPVATGAVRDPTAACGAPAATESRPLPGR